MLPSGSFFASGTGERGLCGGDEGGDDDVDGAGLEARLGDSDAGLRVGRAPSSLLLAVRGLLSLWLRVAWRCLWQQLGGAKLAAWWGKGLVFLKTTVVVPIKELRKAERCEREKVGSGGIRNASANA